CEVWLGKDNLHRLLSVKSRYELRIDLGDFDHNKAFAKYSKFVIGPESDNYRLTAEGYSGDAGDSLEYYNGQQFSTKDRDNDRWSSQSCSQWYKGGWWYDSCHRSNLNGLYNTDKQSTDGKNVVWLYWKSSYPLKFSEMKFRDFE
ncbi:MAG: fibrinogen-related protein, partial [Candidatus Thiodiazotropha sp.]